MSRKIIVVIAILTAIVLSTFFIVSLIKSKPSVFENEIEKSSGKNSCKVGVCVNITECQDYVNLLNTRPLTNEIRTRINESVCEYKYGTVKVCCSSKNEETSKTEPYQISSHKNIKLLPTVDCGNTGNVSEERNSTRLVDFPWMARIISVTNGTKNSVSCVGTVINELYILTSAYCIQSPDRWTFLSEVIVGDRVNCDRKNGCNNKLTKRRITFEAVIVHPYYNPIKNINNIGLIRLGEPIRFSENSFVKPICLPISEDLLNMDMVGQHMVLVGWDLTQNSKFDELLQTQISVVDNAICHKNEYALPSKTLCAMEDDEFGYCTADLGSPLLKPVMIESGLHYVQFGVINDNLNRPCHKYGTPHAFNRISHYVEWILDHLKP